MTSLSIEARRFGEIMTQNNEGLSLIPYTDSAGKLTIGYGRNLTENGISRGEALTLFYSDYRKAEEEVKKYVKCWDNLSDIRKIVLIDMCFNLGLPKLMLFTNMLDAIYNNDFERASHEIMNSKLQYRRKEKLSYYMEMGKI